MTTDIASTPQYKAERRRLQRLYVRAKPTVLEATALDTCAALAARVELAANDPSTTPDAMCKVMAAQRHALALLQEVTKGRRKVKKPTSFREWIRTINAGDNPRGDFISDARNLPEVPTWSALRWHLLSNNACDEAMSQGRQLWSEWTRHRRSRRGAT
jgi:hypothetical protein